MGTCAQLYACRMCTCAQLQERGRRTQDVLYTRSSIANLGSFAPRPRQRAEKFPHVGVLNEVAPGPGRHGEPRNGLHGQVPQQEAAGEARKQLRELLGQRREGRPLSPWCTIAACAHAPGALEHAPCTRARTHTHTHTHKNLRRIPARTHIPATSARTSVSVVFPRSMLRGGKDAVRVGVEARPGAAQPPRLRDHEQVLLDEQAGLRRALVCERHQSRTASVARHRKAQRLVCLSTMLQRLKFVTTNCWLKPGLSRG